jgi:hypothetical protein
MKRLVLTLALIASAFAAQAQYYARGDFNGWGTGNPLTDNLDGTYSTSITGGTSGAYLEWKIAVGDWSSAWPNDNVKSVYDSSGNYTFHFRPGSVSDGWNPGNDRVGYSDPGHGWELMGAFNSWSSPVALTSLGGGLYSGTLTIASPGSTEFKFRKAGDWEVSVGQHFGKAAPNASVVTTTPNELVQFSLDLPNGRWQTTVVPEPTAFALLGLGGLLLAFRRK